MESIFLSLIPYDELQNPASYLVVAVVDVNNEASTRTSTFAHPAAGLCTQNETVPSTFSLLFNLKHLSTDYKA